MTQGIRFSIFVSLGVLFMLSGCASNQNARRLNSVQAQIGVITEELVRLDQSLQEVRGALQSEENRYNELAQQLSSAGDLGAQGGIYKTPSGFTLPTLSIQQALKNAGYYQGKLDGKIGSGSTVAIKAFQKDNGLEADGVVGRKTWAKLKAYKNSIK